MTEKIQYKKLDKNALAPSYGSDYSAGADIYALCETDITIAPGDTFLFHTGLSFEIPVGFVGLVYARSGLASKKGLAPANKVGVIDSDYRGELMVALHNHGKNEQTVSNGDRIAQLVIAPYLTAEFIEAESLTDTVRGNGGFGSTGK